MGKIEIYECRRHGERELLLGDGDVASASITCGQAGPGGPCGVECARTGRVRFQSDVQLVMQQPEWSDDTRPGRRAA